MESAHTVLIEAAGASALGSALGGETSQATEILGVRETARFLHCSVSHVSNILNGRVPNVPPIPHVRAGRLRLIRREALVRWFNEQEAASGKPSRR